MYMHLKSKNTYIKSLETININVAVCVWKQESDSQTLWLFYCFLSPILNVFLVVFSFQRVKTNRRFWTFTLGRNVVAVVTCES